MICKTRKEAKAENCKRYFTGRECVRGHIAERFVSTAECVECLAIRSKSVSPEKKAEYRKKWVEKNPEKQKQAVKSATAKKKEHYLTTRRAWQARNRHLLALQQRERRKGKEAGEAAKAREWRANNREKFRMVKAKNYAKNATCPIYRLTSSMRVSISRGLAKGVKASRRTENLLGYSFDDLRGHLEAQFRDGMSWQNYGKWHVDHIKPLASFNYQSPDDPEFKSAWSLCNLQPLWAVENWSKGSGGVRRITARVDI
jgi:hypothetical protein